ncbi:hypothetical protein B0H15DRAFT_948916 [Mycena belliarum]|uniref:F-box domain-containing protein n=1 Tax=Mycena belliarum TaxID=1033014 RepID=A0AAD6U600_9AGAR|nr:hypothetical protein B0H15DRAFT_948916 [Mycena belliae]
MSSPLSLVHLEKAAIFWHTPDLVFYLFRFLNFITLVRYGGLEKRSMNYVKTYLKGRITRYVAPFFPVNARQPIGINNRKTLRLFHILEETRSWIVGSIPLAVASVLSDAPQPNNLNIITLEAYGYRWMKFFVEECGFGLKVDEPASGAYGAAGCRHVRLVHPLRRAQSITFTTTTAPNLGPLFFAAPNTDQQIAIAAYQIITPYPGAVSDQAHLAGFNPVTLQHPALPKLIPHRTYRLNPRFQGVTTLALTSEDPPRVCGPKCPGVWRKVWGLHGIARVKWGGMDGLDGYTDEIVVFFMASRHIAALPPELLAEIFTVVVFQATGHIYDTSCQWAQQCSAKCAIIQVCKHWRRIILEAAHLWDTVAIYRFTPPWHLDFQLHASKHADLQVTIDARPFTSVEFADVERRVGCRPFEGLLDLVECAFRVAYLRVVRLQVLCPDTGACAALAAALAQVEAPALTSVVVRVSDSAAMDRHVELPCLSTLRLAIHSVELLGPPLLAMHVPPRLKVLKLTYIGDGWAYSWEDLRSALGLAPELEELFLHDVECVVGQSSMVAVLGALKTLVLSYGTAHFVQIVPRIEAPQLETLSITLYGGVEEALAVSFLPPCSHLLGVATNIALCIPCPGEEVFRNFLRCIPSAAVLDARRVHGSILPMLKRALEADALLLPELTLVMVLYHATEAQAQSVLSVLDNGRAESTAVILAGAPTYRTPNHCVRWSLVQGVATGRIVEDTCAYV